ncbi:MAG: DUF6278 family protein [Myxococcales bacterium]|nr:DUF6278 family protein [Myxococcales bacterium]
MSGLPETEERVAELSAACVLAVMQSTGVTLDFTQDTLPILDHHLIEARGAKDEVLALIAPMAGAYFGEVVRRSLPGVRWHIAEAHPSWRIEFERCFLHFNPIGMALEAIVRQEAAGWNAHLELLDEEKATVQEALDLLGEIRADDYYRLSVRYEVIEAAAQRLIGHRQGEGKRLLFGPEAYAAATPAAGGDDSAGDR